MVMSFHWGGGTSFDPVVLFPDNRSGGRVTAGALALVHPEARFSFLALSGRERWGNGQLGCVQTRIFRRVWAPRAKVGIGRSSTVGEARAV